MLQPHAHRAVVGIDGKPRGVTVKDARPKLVTEERKINLRPISCRGRGHAPPSGASDSARVGVGRDQTQLAREVNGTVPVRVDGAQSVAIGPQRRPDVRIEVAENGHGALGGQASRGIVQQREGLDTRLLVAALWRVERANVQRDPVALTRIGCDTQP